MAYSSAYDSESEFLDCFLPLKDRSGQSEYAFHAGAQTVSTLDDFDDSALLQDKEHTQRVRNLRLNVLREESAEVQRQKDRWEQLGAKQSEFHEGRREMIDKLSRSVLEFENEATQAARRAEALKFTVKNFRYHLEQIQGLRPEAWSSQCFDMELDRALELIDDADVEFDRETQHLEQVCGVAMAIPANVKDRRRANNVPPKGGRHPFSYWLMSGIAFSLPMIVLTVLALILVLTAMGEPTILSQR